MKKKRFALVCFIVVCIAFIFVGCSSSGNPYDTAEADDGYVMNNVDVKIDASAGDRTMRITERYTFTYNLASHGFYRDIPVNNGEKIRDVTIAARDFYDEFEVSHENNGKIFRVRIGDADRYVRLRTKLSCTIEYTLYTPAHAEYPNAIVLNAIGQGWSCAIEHAKIEVKLPAETVETPKYYYGGWGEKLDPLKDGVVSSAPESGNSTYSFEVSGLSSFEGITLYYFLGEGVLTTKTDKLPLIVSAVSLALVVLALLFRFLLGRSPELAPVTNFYPPKHPDQDGSEGSSEPMDPVDMGYLIDNTCSGQDVTSLIFYFASKGHLDIEDPDGELTLVHKKDLPESAPSHQQIFFKKLFSSGERVEVSTLTNQMYTAVMTVQTKIKGMYAGKLYDRKSRAASVFLSVLSVLLSFLTVFIASFQISFAYINPFGAMAVFPVIILQLIGTVLVNNRLKMKKPLQYLLYFVCGVVAAVTVLVYACVFPANILPQYAAILLGVGVAGCALLAPFVARRTPYYTNELNEIMGFKDFLQSAEKERLEMLLAENPQYYYDILPYANVLGVSSIWEDKFKNLTVEPPRYYRSSDAVFDLLLFNTFYRRSYARASTVAVSRPSSSSRSGGGFRGGGGFSGGGFGGG
ncbi:MAG: DUF2207 domain-containing protein, partial [Clostridiales bacterium]|nr:DUF2207 domain-containing protein [Clostridiales bacterium]